MVTKETIIADMIAGITGAIIVLPQGIAFATIAGLPPQYGLYTAMVTPIIAALFGSSMHLISGPTTAISLVVFSSIASLGVNSQTDVVSLTLTLTFLAGVYQLAFGIAKLGRVVDFVSHTVVIGFTAGAAILIVTSQLKSLLGIDISAHEFYEVWKEIISKIPETNIYAFVIGIATLLIAVLSKRFFPKIPNLLVALIFGTLITFLIKSGLSLDTNFIKFVPEIPGNLPPLSHPDFSLETIKLLAPSAFAVALLGLIEAISISRSVASKSHQKINADQEFIGQGLSNIVGSFFSSYAGSGSFTRSGVNYSAGAVTPLSAIFAAIFLAIIVLIFAPFTKFLPVPAMAGIILMVGYSLINFKQVQGIFTKSFSETSILLVTFFATLFLELEFAIYLGILLSLVIFLNKTSHPVIATMLSNYDSKKDKRVLVGSYRIPKEKHESLLCPQLEIIRIDMSIYFGSVNYIAEKINTIYTQGNKKHILILCSSVNFIDLSGVEMLEEQNHMLSSTGGGLYFVELKSQVYQQVKKYGLMENIGDDHFFFSKKGAIEYLYKNIIEEKKCINCKSRVFNECGAESTYDYTRDIGDVEKEKQKFAFLLKQKVSNFKNIFGNKK